MATNVPAKLSAAQIGAIHDPLSPPPSRPIPGPWATHRAKPPPIILLPLCFLPCSLGCNGHKCTRQTFSASNSCHPLPTLATPLAPALYVCTGPWATHRAKPPPIILLPLCFLPCSLGPKARSAQRKQPRHCARPHGRMAAGGLAKSCGQALPQALRLASQSMIRYSRRQAFFFLSDCRDPWAICNEASGGA